MADILIRGMEMPKDGRITIQIGADGAVYFVEKCTIMAEKYEKSYHAVPLPEGHGRLIDAEAFVDYMQNRYDNNEITNGDWIDFRLSLKDQPTIMPAEGGTDNECD